MCKMVGPEYERAALLAANASLPFKVAQLNADKYTEVADSLRVSKFPTVFLYRNGVPERFPVLSVGEAYVAGAARMLELPSAEALSPVRTFPTGVDVQDVAGWLFWRGGVDGAIATTVMLYLPPGAEGATLSAAVVEASKSLFQDPNIRFGTVSDPAVLEAFEVSMTAPTLVLYKEHDEGRVEYTGAAEAADIAAWARKHMVPLVTVVTHKNLPAYRAKVKHLGLFFVDAPAVEHKPTLERLQASLLAAVQSLEEIGAVKRGEFTIAVVDGKKYGEWMAHYGLPAGRFPALAVEETGAEAYFSHPDFAEEAACHPPASAAAPPPPEAGTPEFEALPDGYDVTAPYVEVDGRPMHTAPWCKSGGTWAASRIQRHLASLTVAVDASGSVVEPGIIPSFEQGFTHGAATVALTEAERAGRLAALAGGISDLPEDELDQLFPPLFWVSVPDVSVPRWLQRVVNGGIAPIRPPGKAPALPAWARAGTEGIHADRGSERNMPVL